MKFPIFRFFFYLRECKSSKRARAGRATGRHGAQRACGREGAVGAQGGRRAGLQVRGAAGARGSRRVGRNKGAQGAWQGRGLGALLANGLCTWCTQPVLAQFDSVLFLSQFLDFVRELGS